MVDWNALLGVLGPIVVAIVGGGFAIWTARTSAKPQIGSLITSGFKELTDQLQQERQELNEIVTRQRDLLEKSERDILKLQRHQRQILRHVDMLERQMTAAGMQIPPLVLDD